MSGETKCFKVLNFVANTDDDEFLEIFGKIAKESACNSDISKIVDTVTTHYNENVFIHVSDFAALSKNIEMLRKRPFFIHVHIEFEISLLLKILAIEESKILNFITEMEKTQKIHESIYSNSAIKINIKNSQDPSTSANDEYLSLLEKNFENQLLRIPIFQSKNLSTPQGRTSPLRPSWDEYFMQLANLASTRSNCMKRKVGCCIVSNKKVIATGYNGTPRNLLNCFSGGCKRCNITSIDTSSPKTVHNLGTCYCLHAEENALLEAGNIRIDKGCTLYCDTCPCITCSVKIVQAGIGEVVYSQSYNMDGESIAIFDNAGIKIRQFDHTGVNREFNITL
ncbi:hypothetical protein ACO0R3_004019 [Hanseniaspora guilliermondii]